MDYGYSTILQLYHGGQFKLCRKPEYQGKQPICHKSLRKLTLSHCYIEYRSPQTLAVMDTGYIGTCIGKSNLHRIDFDKMRLGCKSVFFLCGFFL